MIKEGATPADLARQALGVIDFEILEERNVEFRCNCSMERARSMIGSLGQEEVRSMLEDDKGAMMTCGFCSQRYELSEEDLENIILAEN